MEPTRSEIDTPIPAEVHPSASAEPLQIRGHDPSEKRGLEAANQLPGDECERGEESLRSLGTNGESESETPDLSADGDLTPERLENNFGRDWNPIVHTDSLQPSSHAVPYDVPVIIIRPTGGWRALDLREVWRYRELMVTLAWREITIRYKQTFLGAAWAVIQPLMTTGIFSVLFALLMGRGNEPAPQGIPYVVSTFCAMLPWQLFATSLNQSGNILLQYRSMITKIYFPRLILPAAAVLSTLVDFSIALLALFVVMTLYGVVPTWAVIFLPGFVLLAVAAALAVGLWLAALNAIYRDFRYVIPFIIQLGMFVSPVVYSTEAIRDKLSPLALMIYSLNPMVGVIEGFRWALLGAAPPPSLELGVSAVATILILVGGMFYFRRMETLIADVI